MEDFIHAARRLDQLDLDDFADYGLDHPALDYLRLRFADWPRHEPDDQEGRAVHAAVAAEEQAARAEDFASPTDRPNPGGTPPANPPAKADPPPNP